MKTVFPKIFTSPILLILMTVLVKIPLLFTKNIQEDSFITWRVARNLVNYGVMGFNGSERISASTTHLYVFITAFFQLMFGENFIFPLLVFSGILFGIGSWWIAKILFSESAGKRVIFLLLLNITPPALTASFLGMEYGILFFLYSGLLYFGLSLRKKWAFWIFPILLLWTRIDTVIFLGIFFLADFYLKKKINAQYFLGGFLGLISVISFNYFYFGELVNHTITAKNIAYKNLTQNNSTEFFLYQWAYYGGLIKKYGFASFVLFISFLTFLGFAFFKILKNRFLSERRVKIILGSMLVFALVKITVFSAFKAYFDWYYWLPRAFLFIIVLYYFLQIQKWKNKLFVGLVSFLFLSLYCFQLLQSYAIGYMEERQRMTIASDILKSGSSLEKSILLEPAGIIPFYTQLYTYDEVGLVNKRINDEMILDEIYWWSNSVEKFQPDYILTIASQPAEADTFYLLPPGKEADFNNGYTLIKKYSISRIHQNSPWILRKIYEIRPIGKDYYLYRNKSSKL